MLLVGANVGHVLGLHSRVQIDIKGKDVEGEDKGDGPLQHRTGIIVLGEGASDEGDS